MEADPFSHSILNLDSIFLSIGPEFFSILGISILILLLLFCSALISGSEIAFFSLSPNDEETLNQDSTRISKRLIYLKENPRKLLATILISNNFINIAIVILSDFLVGKIFTDTLLDSLSKSITHGLSDYIILDPERLQSNIGFLITIVAVTFLLVLFGEVAPKVYASCK